MVKNSPTMRKLFRKTGLLDRYDQPEVCARRALKAPTALRPAPVTCAGSAHGSCLSA